MSHGYLKYEADKLISRDVVADTDALAGEYIRVSSGAFSRVITLPEFPVKDDVIQVSKIDSNEGEVFVDPNGKEINDKVVFALRYQYETIRLRYTGFRWDIEFLTKPVVEEFISTVAAEVKVGSAIKLTDNSITLVKADITAITNDKTLGYSNVITATVRVAAGVASIVGVEDSIENSDFPVGATSTIGVISDDVFVTVTGAAGELINWTTKLEIL